MLFVSDAGIQQIGETKVTAFERVEVHLDSSVVRRTVLVPRILWRQENNVTMTEELDPDQPTALVVGTDNWIQVLWHVEDLPDEATSRESLKKQHTFNTTYNKM